MAMIECRSAQPGVKSVMVEVPGITDDQVKQARKILDNHLKEESTPSNAVAKSYVAIVALCPRANPSDLWQQIVYRHLLASGWSDNKWKRVSGYALERALSLVYRSQLAQHGLRMVQLPAAEVKAELEKWKIDVAPSKTDLLLQGKSSGEWRLLGAAHVKASIAERIQDDVPASSALMDAGLVSVILTMDAKSWPPPHGDCVNYGELGGRQMERTQQRIKRDYVEVHGQFDALFSFNLRTPESATETESGKRIHTLSLSESQPDKFVRFLIEKNGGLNRR